MMKWIKRALFAIITFLVLMVALASITYLYRYVAMQGKIVETGLTAPPQVWAHKGFHRGITQNSIKGFKKAFEMGVRGIELDTHYDRDLDRFVVSHNKPYRRHNGELLYLEKVFGTTGKSGYYWIDLKNLADDNIDGVTNRMNLLLDRYDLRELVFIESWHGPELSVLSNRGFKTIYWLSFKHKPGSLDHMEELFRRRGIILDSNFVAVSGAYQNFQDYPPDILNNFPMFVFTINDQASFNQFANNKRVKVILTDNPDFYPKKHLESVPLRYSSP